MSSVFKVGDAFRTNNLSLKPGGSTVNIYYSDNTIRIYDKIKNPARYISSLERIKSGKKIIKITVDDVIVWELI